MKKLIIVLMLNGCLTAQTIESCARSCGIAGMKRVDSGFCECK